MNKFTEYIHQNSDIGQNRQGGHYYEFWYCDKIEVPGSFAGCFRNTAHGDVSVISYMAHSLVESMDDNVHDDQK